MKDATKATGDGETVLLENGADIKAAPLPATNETVEVAQLYSTARLVVVFISLCMCMLLAALVGCHLSIRGFKGLGNLAYP